MERLLALFLLSFVSDTIPCFWLSNEGFSPLPPLLLCYVVPGSTASFEFSSIHPLSSTRSCSQASPDATVSLPPPPTPGQRSARNSQDSVLLPAECSLDHIIKPAQRELMRRETTSQHRVLNLRVCFSLVIKFSCPHTRNSHLWQSLEQRMKPSLILNKKSREKIINKVQPELELLKSSP